MAKYIGCDLGGTNLRAGVVDTQTGSVSHLTSIPTLAREGHDAVMARMGQLFLDVIGASGLRREDFGGIGIGVPGVVDLEKGEVVFLPNLPGTWPNVPLQERITALTGLPVRILNDVRSITFGEWRFGAGRGADTMACFAVGTGVGGGLVINRRLYLGMGGTAGELGHQTIDFNGPRCGCGNRGCLEAYASGPALAALGVRAVMQGLTTSIGELVDYDLNRITPEVVAQAARQGDEIACSIYDQVGTYLGVAVASVIVMLTPERVVIGGGVARAGDLLLAPLRRTAFDRAAMMRPQERVEIVPAELGNNAGVIGVALWAEENIAPL